MVSATAVTLAASRHDGARFARRLSDTNAPRPDGSSTRPASEHTPHAAEHALPAPRARLRQRLRLSLTPRRTSSSRRGLHCPLRPCRPASRIRQRPPRRGLACAADAQTPTAGCLTVVGCLIAAGKPGIAPRHEAGEPMRRRATDSRPGHSYVERRFTQSAMKCQTARSPNSKAARRAFCERIAPPRPTHTAERSASWRSFRSPRAFHRHLQRRPPRFPALCGAFRPAATPRFEHDGSWLGSRSSSGRSASPSGPRARSPISNVTVEADGT